MDLEKCWTFYKKGGQFIHQAPPATSPLPSSARLRWSTRRKTHLCEEHEVERRQRAAVLLFVTVKLATASQRMRCSRRKKKGKAQEGDGPVWSGEDPARKSARHVGSVQQVVSYRPQQVRSWTKHEEEKGAKQIAHGAFSSLLNRHHHPRLENP